jgi:hypothetical protein
LGAEFNALVYPRSPEPCSGKVAAPEEPASSIEPALAKEK